MNQYVIFYKYWESGEQIYHQTFNIDPERTAAQTMDKLYEELRGNIVLEPALL